MTEKASSTQAVTANDFEKNTDSRPSLSGGPLTSDDDASIGAGSVQNSGQAMEIQRGLKSRHIQFL
jgi:hypothetical protein